MKRKTGNRLQVCENYFYNTDYDRGCIESAPLWVVPNAQGYK